MNAIDVRLDFPNVAELRVFYEAAPGTIVKKVHRKVVGQIAKRGRIVMKKNIRRMFPLYSPGDRTKSGQKKRWQTPTGALANSIGVKLWEPKNKQQAAKLAMAFIGARSDFVATKSVRARINRINRLGWNKAPRPLHIPKGPSGQTIRPARYIHLALHGHTPGPSGRSIYAEGVDFMTPTVQELRGIADQIVRTQFPVEFEKVMDKDTQRVVRRMERSRIRKRTGSA